MKVFLNKMNSRIDLLVETLKTADSMIAKKTVNRSLLEQIREKRKQKKECAMSEPQPNQSAFLYFKKQMRNISNETKQ